MKPVDICLTKKYDTISAPNTGWLDLYKSYI